jgi:hypothetical protein
MSTPNSAPFVHTHIACPTHETSQHCCWSVGIPTTVIGGNICLLVCSKMLFTLISFNRQQGGGGDAVAGRLLPPDPLPG